MLTVEQLLDRYRSGRPCVFADVGDSTGAGMGVNPGPGGPYMLDNLPNGGPNFTSGDPLHIAPDSVGYVSQAVQDNLLIPSPARLFRSRLEITNPGSKVYNFSASGWTADEHVLQGTVARLAALPIKPHAAFFPIGINNLKNGIPLYGPMLTLCNQAIAAAVLPIVCLQHNIGHDVRTGRWDGLEVPGFPGPPEYWAPVGAAWTAKRLEARAVAQLLGIPCIDYGDDGGGLDLSELYDPYHVNAKGAAAIDNRRAAFLDGEGVYLRFSDAQRKFYPNVAGAARLLTTAGVMGFAFGGDGPVRITTPDGVKNLQ